MKKLLIIISIFTIQFSILNAQETWVQTYQPFYNQNGGNGYQVEDVLVCDDGGYAVNGYYWYFDDWEQYQWGYLMKTDSEGNFQWAKKDTVSWIGETESSAFVQTDDGGYLSAVFSLWGGSVLIKRDSEGNREWVENCGDFYIHSMDNTNDGKIILGGRMNGLPAMRKINQNGDIVWEDSYYLSGSGDGSVQSIISLSDGGYATTGYTSGNGFDIFVLKVNSTGDSLWSNTFDGYGNLDEGFCIIENVNQELFMSGYFRPDNRLIYAVLIKLTNEGNVAYILSEFNSNNEYGIRSMVDNTINIIGYGRGNMYSYNYDGESLWMSDLAGNSGRGDKCLSIINDRFICAGESWEGIILTKTDSTGQVVATSENVIHSESYNMFCYPNPFNPEIIISFNLSSAKSIKIDIFNAKGQLIKVLLNEPKEVGSHSVIWNAKEYSSGIYFVQLFHDNELKRIKKITLLK
ncbi:MAG: T9SS type A sorting domain-containing protein [Candidatus Cloacimonetes bacterium]|jgi:hypothetical protein|nr:T9SS type A sorting domain-containing protein [Candidatus Cloacimonadota bacterium]